MQIRQIYIIKPLSTSVLRGHNLNLPSLRIAMTRTMKGGKSNLQNAVSNKNPSCLRKCNHESTMTMMETSRESLRSTVAYHNTYGDGHCIYLLKVKNVIISFFFFLFIKASVLAMGKGFSILLCSSSSSGIWHGLLVQH